MTSKQREDAENGKFSRFKLFFFKKKKHFMLIIGKIGGTQVIYVFDRGIKVVAEVVS